MRVVLYDASKPKTIKVGERAWVVPLNHPSQLATNGDETDPIHTTVVTSYNAVTGVFVTQSTKYVPEGLEV